MEAPKLTQRALKYQSSGCCNWTLCGRRRRRLLFVAVVAKMEMAETYVSTPAFIKRLDGSLEDGTDVA